MPMINKLTIIGVGLIGGSLARALKKAQACKTIMGSGRNPAELEKALQLGVIDEYHLDLGSAVHGADIVVLATPVGAFESVLEQIAGHLAPHTLITDVGSTKGSVIEAARKVFNKKVPAQFVPGHPIAGTEKSGVEASLAELFQDRRVILTPLSTTSEQAVARIRMMWETTGAEVVEMDARRHDEVLAATSHLPHVLAYTLVDTLARLNAQQEIFGFAAGGFRDFTRIASSDPQMWHDICLANRSSLLSVLEQFSNDLDHFTEALRDRDGARILSMFTRAKIARDHTVPVYTPPANVKKH